MEEVLRLVVRSVGEQMLLLFYLICPSNRIFVTYLFTSLVFQLKDTDLRFLIHRLEILIVLS
jgi:hypothetical protein